MNKFRKPFIIILIVLLISGMMSGDVRSFTSAKELTTGMKLALDYSTCLAKKKDIKEGTKAMVYKQIEDKMWYTIGGMEKYINATDKSEYTNKAKALYKIYKKVPEIAANLGSGEVTDAFISAVEAAVDAFGPPVVKALHYSLKMAYDSDKLVKSTNAALQIESLYGTLDRDRKLFGSPDENGLIQFEINSDTVDYFFNRYLITDDGVRSKVKEYVKVRLEEEFPEYSYWDRFKSLIYMTSSVDDKRSQEIEELSQFRNVSRRWIGMLLKDINTQAQVNYSMTRARKELKEFEVFVKQYEAFTQDLDELSKSFLEIKKMKEEEAEFPKIMADIKKKKQKIIDTLNNTEKTNAGKIRALAEECFNLKLVPLKYYSMAHIIGNAYYYTNFLMEVNELEKLREDILSSLEEGLGNIAEKEREDVKYVGTIACIGDNGQKVSCDYIDWPKKHFKDTLAPLVEHVIFIKEPKEIKRMLLDLLNSGAFLKARDLISEWTEREAENIRKHYQEIREDVEERKKKSPIKPTETFCKIIAPHNCGKIRDHFHVKSNFAYAYPRPACCSMYESVYIFPDAEGNDPRWIDAINKTLKLIDEMKSLQNDILLNHQRHFMEIYNEYGEIRTLRLQYLGALRKSLFRMYSLADYYVEYGWKPHLHNDLKEALKKSREDSHVMISISDNNPVIVTLPAILTARADDYNARAFLNDTMVQVFDNEIMSKKDDWKLAIDLWRDLEKPDERVAEEIMLLVYDGSNYEPGLKIVIFDYLKEYVKFSYVMRDLPAKLTEMNLMLKEYKDIKSGENNRLRQDSSFLYIIGSELKAWISSQMENRILVMDYAPTGRQVSEEVARTFTGDLRLHHDGMDFITGMIMVSEPYPHYMDNQELEMYFQKYNSVKAELDASRAGQFIKSNLPEHYAVINNIFSPKGIKPAKEPNIIIGRDPDGVVWQSAVERANPLVDGINPEHDSYYQQMKELSEMVPGLLEIYTDEDLKKEQDKVKSKPDLYALMPGGFNILEKKANPVGKLLPVNESVLGSSELGRKFLTIREKVEGLIRLRVAYLQKEFKAYWDKDSIKNYLEDISKIRSEIQKKKPDEHILNRISTDFYALYNSYIKSQNNYSEVSAAFEALEKELFRLRDSLSSAGVDAIRDFYDSFKKAYESRNDSVLMSYLGDDWQAGDGTTLSDLQMNFARTFRTFDEIRFSIQNMVVQKTVDGNFLASYDVTITSRIYSRNIKHEEKSSVSEIVNIGNGKARITKTISGRFWYMQ